MDDIFELMMLEQQKQELIKILTCNQKTEQFGLVLSQEEANALLINRKNSLSDNLRIEFGESILPKIINVFCNSQYINQDSYAEILSELQEIFYLFKNEAQDELTDDELLDFMKKQYEEICFGDLEYLRNTCLERYAKAVRSGYQSKMQERLRDEYSLRSIDEEDAYEKLSEETRWDYEVYKTKLEDLF
jgi:hypothetical protein